MIETLRSNCYGGSLTHGPLNDDVTWLIDAGEKEKFKKLTEIWTTDTQYTFHSH